MNLFLRKVVPVLTFLYISGIATNSNAQLSFANPLLDFDSIICVARGQTVIDHVCDQYMGCYAIPGGSVYIVSGFKNNARKVTDLLANATVESGRYKGRKLTGGSFISPELSYDGKTVYFGWKVGSPPPYNTDNPSWALDQCYHIFKINIDGTKLVQLTDGNFNDFDPCCLPSGRIAFISERRGGYGRCHKRKVPTYTLYSMKADGSDIICLSYHETNEWHPSVDNNGMLIYSRWDYVDRDDCIAHHMWICYPDGRDPRSWHGNYPLPLTTMEGSNWPDGRNFRPWSEFNVRAIPNSTKYVATGSGHHTQAFGELVIIDLNVPDDGKMSQITGITTKRTTWPDNAGQLGTWATPYPLSENYYLASHQGDIVFIDTTAKDLKSLMVCPKSATPVANNANLKLIDPIPVKPRTPPTDIPVQTFEGEREKLSHSPASISVLNVYESDLPLPAGTKIKWLRVIQLIPKATPIINEPSVCAASESLVRLPLGIVPVESDGSANFEAPVDRALYFQLLDSNYMAVQSMRSLTYAHKGERLTCTGCHEDKWKSTPNLDPVALKRAPSKLKPEFIEALPMSYFRCVKPVFDAKCASCHAKEKKGPDMSYNSLANYIFHFCDGGWPYTNGNITAPVVGGSRSIPGKVGARVSKLYNYCKPSHHNVALTKDELHRITLWLDCNSNRLGAEHDTTLQIEGKLVWPSLDIDTLNLLGLEDPTSTDAAIAAKVTPAATMVKPGNTAQFTAVAVDLLNRKVASQPTFSWTVSGGGSINQSGLFTAGTIEGGPFTVTAAATIDGVQRSYTASVTVSTVSGLPLPGGNLQQMLCLNKSGSTCTPAGDTASIENRCIGGDKAAPLPGESFPVNGSTYQWDSQTSQDGSWFSNCGGNLVSYASITIVNTKERSFKIGYTHDDHITVWMKGVRVLSDRNWTTAEKLSASLSMPSGNVVFIIKQTNTAGSGSLVLRFTDNNGNNLNDLLYANTSTTGLKQGVVAHFASVVPYKISTSRSSLNIAGVCSESYRVELFNARGKRLAVSSGTGNMHYVVPTMSLPTGMVIVRMVVDGKKYSEKVPLMGK